MKKEYPRQIQLSKCEWKALDQLCAVFDCTASDLIGKMLARQYGIYWPTYVNRKSHRLSGCFYDLVTMVSIMMVDVNYHRPADVRRMLDMMHNAQKHATDDTELHGLKFLEKDFRYKFTSGRDFGHGMDS